MSRTLLRRLIGRRPDRHGQAALSLYRHESRGARLHTLIRWYSCPFPDIAAALPVAGRILEIGCGHGLFCAYAALSGPGRSMLGTDIDEAKIAHARDALAPIADRVEVRVEPDGQVPVGPWDAIVIVDMLYLLPEGAQRALLVAAANELAPDGALVIKEMDARPRWKARWNQLQETVSVRLLRITEGGDMTFVPQDAMAAWLRDAGLSVTARRLDRSRLHPHSMLVARP